MLPIGLLVVFGRERYVQRSTDCSMRGASRLTGSWRSFFVNAIDRVQDSGVLLVVILVEVYDVDVSMLLVFFFVSFFFFAHFSSESLCFLVPSKTAGHKSCARPVSTVLNTQP